MATLPRRIGMRAPDLGAARRLAGELFNGFSENDLLTYASAIAFQTLFAVIPTALAGLALLGFLDLEDVWTANAEPELRERVSADAFAVIDRTVDTILSEGRGFWLTLGLVLAVWQVSAAVRAVMGVLGNVYDAEDDRGFWRRHAVSIALALVVMAGLGGAAAAVQFGQRLAALAGDHILVDVASFVLRWAVAVALMLVVVATLVRFAPARRQPVAWVGFGSVVIVAGWIAATAVFGWYATSLADYGSVYGGLAAVIVLLTYLLVSAIAFVAGAQVDALVRRRASGSDTGDVAPAQARRAA